MGRSILEAKQKLPLGKRTLALLYAADYANQLMHKVIPALEAGCIVLADRYIFTPMARNTVRGLPRRWSRDLFGFTVKPDLVFYLDVDPDELFHRVFQKYSGSRLLRVRVRPGPLGRPLRLLRQIPADDDEGVQVYGAGIRACADRRQQTGRPGQGRPAAPHRWVSAWESIGHPRAISPAATRNSPRGVDGSLRDFWGGRTRKIRTTSEERSEGSKPQ